MPSCPKCSQFVEPGRRYCGSCGASLENLSAFVKTMPQKAPKENDSISLRRVPTQAELDALTAEVKSSPTSPDVYYKLGMAQLAAGKADRAFSTYRAGKALAPEDMRIHRLGAEVFEALGRIDEAIAALDAVVRLSPKGDIEAALHSAKLLHDSGRRQKALERLQTLRAASTRYPEVLLRLAEVELSLGDAPSAQKDLSLYRKQVGETREMFHLLGRAMMSQSFYDGAVKHYRDALGYYPNDVELHLGLGRAYLGTGDKAEALLELERALAYNAGNSEALFELGRLYGEMGVLDKSEEMFERIRKQPEKSGEVLLAMALVYRSRRQTAQALADLELARGCSPYHPDIVRVLCEIFEEENKYDSAIIEYERFLESQPAAFWALEGIVRCARVRGDFERMAKAQQAIIESGRETPDAWCDLGETLIRLGRFSEAEKAFENAARLDPTCTRAYQAPELIKIEKARTDGEKLVKQAQEAVQKKFLLTAVERMERALELVPRETSWMRFLAEISLKTGSFGRAAELLSRVRAATPRDSWVCRQLARIYEFEDKQALALELLSSTLKDQPQDIDAHIALLRLKRSQIKGDRFERDTLSALLRNLHIEMAPLGKNDPVPTLVEGYAHYIFGYGTKSQEELLKRAEELFAETLYRDTDNVWAHRGLALIFRARGDVKKAAHHLQEMIRQSSDPSVIYMLARLYENFQFYDDAANCYTSLKNLFPEDGLYRKRIIEMLAHQSEVGGKNPLIEFLTKVQENFRNSPDDVWCAYELAVTQTLVARKTSQRDEWARKALLSWNKAASLNDAPPCSHWGLAEAQMEFLKGAERLRALNQNLKVCEKIVREHPDTAAAYEAVAKCYLGFDDLVQTERAVKHLETAVFLEPSLVERLLSLANAYRELGRAARVDAIRQHVILSEPELSLKM